MAVKTPALAGSDVAARLNAALPGIVIDSGADYATVPSDRVVEAAMFLRDDEELDCKYLNTLLGIDWLDHFVMVYVVSSLAKNHSFVLKARSRHLDPVVPSVSSVWLGAHLQEREVYDLMGIAFSDHPDLKRIFLWEGFPGHPLRKDFLALPGGYKPGLQRFPFEFPAGQRSYPSVTGTESPTAPSVPLLDSMPQNSAPVAPGTNAAGGQLGTMGGGVQGGRSDRVLGAPVEAQATVVAQGDGPGLPDVPPNPEANAEAQSAPSDLEQAPPDARPGANA
jgi:NADH-quinone oxidoreductase subunit C